jgi:hypothetical protein
LSEITQATEQSVEKPARRGRRVYWLLLAAGLLGFLVASYLVIAGDHDKMPVKALPAVYWYYLVLAAFSVAVLDVALVHLFARSPASRIGATLLAAALVLLQGLLRGFGGNWSGLTLFFFGITVGFIAAAVWLAVEASSRERSRSKQIE